MEMHKKRGFINVESIKKRILELAESFLSATTDSRDNYIYIIENDTFLYEVNIIIEKKIKGDVSVEEKVSSDDLDMFIFNIFNDKNRKKESNSFYLRYDSNSFLKFKLNVLRKSRQSVFFHVDPGCALRKRKVLFSEQIIDLIKESKDAGVSLSDITIRFKNFSTNIVKKNMLSALEVEGKIISKFDKTKGRMRKMFYMAESNE